MNRKTLFFSKDDPGSWQDVLTIDPGIRHLGWAYWKELRRPAKKAVAPTESGVQRNEKGIPQEACVANLTAWLASFAHINEVKHVVLEYPQLYSASAKSLGSSERGDLFILTYLIGGLAEQVRLKCVNGPILVYPREWKGQMGKDVVDRRIKRALKKEYRDHESDAVGIGLAIQGVL